MSTRTPSSASFCGALLLGALLALAALSSSSRASADDDPMAPYRERFKAGMEHYKAGDLPTAISDWESIYREVGTEKGYRIAFDLARAYDKSGDLAHAGDRYRVVPRGRGRADEARASRSRPSSSRRRPKRVTRLAQILATSPPAPADKT